MGDVFGVAHVLLLKSVCKSVCVCVSVHIFSTLSHRTRRPANVEYSSNAPQRDLL